MKRVAILPNIITTGNMVCGLSAVLYSLASLQTGDSEDFIKACVFVMLAILLDGLDGRVAVLTKSCSDFGIQFDSLADLISFGVAPAFLMVTHLHQNPVGDLNPQPMCWAVMVVMVVCVALRLARFNLQMYQKERNSFQGLPSPAAAGFLAALLWSIKKYPAFSAHPVVLFLIIIVLGGLMVSHISYPSLKKRELFTTQPHLVLFLVALLFALVITEPAAMLLLMWAAYVSFGLVRRFAPNWISESFARIRETIRSSA